MVRLSVVLLAVAAVAHAEPGSIDWSKRVIRATGQGAPDLNAANIAVARLGAERAAKLDALRNILETLKGVSVASGQTAGDVFADAAVKAKVEGVCKGFKIIEPKRYYSDGGVEMDVEMPIDAVAGILIDKAAPAKPPEAPKVSPPKGELPPPVPDKEKSAGIIAPEKPTGLVIDARGLKATPAFAPRVFDEAGKEIYGPAIVSREAALKTGVAGYATDLEKAKKDERVGPSPAVIKAIKLANAGKSDLVIAARDAAGIVGPTDNRALAEGRVIIVTD